MIDPYDLPKIIYPASEVARFLLVPHTGTGVRWPDETDDVNTPTSWSLTPSFFSTDNSDPEPTQQQVIDAVGAWIASPPIDDSDVDLLVGVLGDRVSVLETLVAQQQIDIANAQASIAANALAIQLINDNLMTRVDRMPGSTMPAGNTNILVYCVSMGSWFSWHPEVGTEGEWLSLAIINEGGGVNSTNVNPGLAMRRYNGMAMSATTGIPMYNGISIRLMSAIAAWDGQENGATFDVLLSNTLIGSMVSTDGFSAQALFDPTDAQFRIGTTTSENLWLRYASASVSSISRPQMTITVKISVLAGQQV